MKTFISQFILGAALLAPASLFAQAYTEGLINVPGAAFSDPRVTGIDNDNQIVGYFEDAQAAKHGFLVSNGVFAQIDRPGASDTYSQAINSVKGIVGFSQIHPNRGEYYLDGGRAFKILKNAGNKSVTGINASGAFVGYEYIGKGAWQGFLNTNGVYAYFVPSVCASLTPPLYLQVNGINVHGDLVGYCQGTDASIVGFARVGGVDQTVSVFGSPTVPTSINDSGVIAGYFGSTIYVAHGFLYSEGVATQWDFESGSSYTATQILGVNKSGSLVGMTYQLSSGHWFPFYALAN